MTEAEIQSLFNEALKQRALTLKVPGITRHQIYNWRDGRTVAKLGDMLNVLYHLKLITVKNEFTPE